MKLYSQLMYQYNAKHVHLNYTLRMAEVSDQKGKEKNRNETGYKDGAAQLGWAINKALEDVVVKNKVRLSYSDIFQTYQTRDTDNCNEETYIEFHGSHTKV